MHKISSEKFHKVLEQIIKDNETYGAVKKRDEYIYDRLETLSDLEIENYVPTVLPPKKYFYPQEEDLVQIDYKTKKANRVIFKKEIVLLGVRPCDINAISLFDRIMSDGNPDPNYLERRKHITVIGFDCVKSCWEHALCEAVGTINVKEGYDLFFSEYKKEYVIKTGSKKGEELFDRYIKNSHKLSEKERDDYHHERAERIKKFNHKVKYLFQDVSSIFEKHYDDPYWKEIGKICLMCGSCVMVCPTCYCFTMDEEVDLKLQTVTRKRKWDGCMLRDFAMVAGNHNFRPTAEMRLKHRWNRKFNYLLKKYHMSNCVGCGRCGFACLVKINPIDILNTIMGNYYSGVKHESEK
ncbi:MAG: 4Fe-4S dicluster domain-containing protein [Spirochaetes bacterium]|nr:4Fe-4S dicluster domain-containing protein [Spirochaetota bacterium]